MRTTISAIAALFLLACGSPDTELLGDECDANGQCPAGFMCNPVTNRCIAITSRPPDAGGAPPTTILTRPEPFTSAPAAIFTFTSNVASATFECKVDGAAFASCTSPFMTTVTEGAHTFTVRARAGGLVDPAPPSAMWTLDTTKPTVTITGGPTGEVSITEAVFTFTSSDPSATFQCKLDGGAFAACTSGQRYTVTAGAHLFTVTAKDAAGNISDPATRSFTVATACVPPATSITGGPPSVTRDTTATFGFTSPAAGATFECRLDGGAFRPCTSPSTFADLTEAAHTFEVRAVVAGAPAGCAVDESPAVHPFTVDLTRPIAVIDSGAEGGIVLSTSVTFTFHADPASATVECALEGAFAPCDDGTITYADLVLGRRYTFEVRATADGVTGPPASRGFVVIGGTINVTAPTGLTGGTGVVLAFGPVYEELEYTCALDAASLGPCSSGMTLPALEDGDHVVTVTGQTPGGVAVASGTTSFESDGTPPVIAIAALPPIVGPGASISYGVTDDNAVTFTCSITNDGVTEEVPDCASTTTFSLAGLATGPTTFEITAIDEAGNMEMASVTFLLDATGPTFIIVPPNVREAGGLGFTCSSGTISFFVDTSLPEEEDPDTTVEVAFCTLTSSSPRVHIAELCFPLQGFSFEGLATGDYTLSVSGEDVHGNPSEGLATLRFHVDGTGPTIAIATPPSYLPPPDDQTSSCGTECPVEGTTTGIISYTATDDPPPVGEATCEIDGAPCAASCVAKRPQVAPYQFCSLEDGEHSVTVTAVDPCGNEGSSTNTWTVDATGPVVDSLQVSVGALGAATVSYAAADSHSSIASFVCTLDGAAVTCPTVPGEGFTASGMVTFAAGDLSPGEHVFAVHAIDVWENVGAQVSNAPGDFVVAYGGSIGHAVLIGHDFSTANADAATVLGNALSLAAFRQATASQRAIRALAYYPGAGADGPMSAADHDNSRAAIETLGAGVVLTEFGPGVPDTGDATDLPAALRGKDVLVVYDLQSPPGSAAPDVDELRTTWQTTLATFIERGGVVVVLDGRVSADTFSDNWRILSDGSGGGLMSEVTGVQSLPAGATAPTVVAHCDPDDHPLRSGAAESYGASTNTVGFALDPQLTAPSVLPIYTDGSRTMVVVLDKSAALTPAQMTLIGTEATNVTGYAIAFNDSAGTLAAVCSSMRVAAGRGWAIHGVDANAFMTLYFSPGIHEDVPKEEYWEVVNKMTFAQLQPFDVIRVHLTSSSGGISFPGAQDQGNTRVYLPTTGVQGAAWYRVQNAWGCSSASSCGDVVTVADGNGDPNTPIFDLTFVGSSTPGTVVAQALDADLNTLAYMVRTDVGVDPNNPADFREMTWETAGLLPLTISNLPVVDELRASATLQSGLRSFNQTPTGVLNVDTGQTQGLPGANGGAILRTNASGTQSFGFFTSSLIPSLFMRQVVKDILNFPSSTRTTHVASTTTPPLALRYDEDILPLVHDLTMTMTVTSGDGPTQLRLSWDDGGSTRLDDVGATTTIAWNDSRDTGVPCGAETPCGVGRGCSSETNTCWLGRKNTWRVLHSGAGDGFTLPPVPPDFEADHSPTADDTCFTVKTRFEESDRIIGYDAYKAAHPSFSAASTSFPYTFILTTEPDEFAGPACLL
jgi:hypothetical protein